VTSWVTWPARAEVLARQPVVVLFGGTSGERDVSLSSGRAVLEALDGDPRLGELRGVEIVEDGRWDIDGVRLVAPNAVQALPDDALYLLALHGCPGEDGRMQAFLELCERRYTGAGPMASSTCMDKRRAREAVAAAQVRVSPARLVAREPFADDPAPDLAAIVALGPGPWFVKPNCGGSSLGVTRASDEKELRRGLEAALEVEPDALVELGQDGVEVTCGVIGNRGEAPVLLPVVEILPRGGGFFDYSEKYDEDGARELCPPEHLSPEAAARVQARALTAYRATGCEGYARIDFISGGEAEPVFLEANTLPGFTPRSILPRAAEATGVDFADLCLELCARALARFERAPLR